MNISVRSSIRQIAASACHAASLPLSRLKGKVVVLMYHRVLSDKDIALQFVESGMYVKKDVFEMHVKYLKQHFHILQFSDLLDLWTEKAVKETERYCVITFDDGWLDNYLHAFPILKRYNVPATIFIPTDFIGTSQWFWPDKIGFLLSYCFNNMDQTKKEVIERLPWFGHTNGETSIEKLGSVIQSLKTLPDEDINYLIGSMMDDLRLKMPDERVLLNWKEIAEMSQCRISFGSHSSSHRILTKLNIEDVSRDAEKSLRIIKEKEINHIPVFCYPNGDFNGRIAERISDVGFKAAVSTSFGFEGSTPADMFGIRRIGIHNDISSSEPLFGMRISGLDRIGL